MNEKHPTSSSPFIKTKKKKVEVYNSRRRRRRRGWMNEEEREVKELAFDDYGGEDRRCSAFRLLLLLSTFSFFLVCVTQLPATLRHLIQSKLM